MPHAIEMKDGKILTPFGIRDLLEAVSDYAGEELAREILFVMALHLSSYCRKQSMSMATIFLK